MDNFNENNVNVKESFKNDIFKVNPIEFQNNHRLICMQSQNGPCPLIAILNCLLLNGEIVLESNTEFLTGEEMVNRLLNYILEKENECGDLKVIIDHFNELQTGLVVNVRFSNVSDFEGCNRLHIFDVLGIKLYHGWLMDPQATPEYELLRNYSYDQAAEDLVQDNDILSPETKIFLREFINSSQLTYPGLCQLNEAMKENELAILFHNNHFSVIYKMEVVYLLSTDIGYSDVPGMVWQLLNSINGDTEFVNDKFEPVQSSYNNTTVEDPDYELAKKLAMDDEYKLAMDNDFKLAVELQENEDEEAQQRRNPLRLPESVMSESQASGHKNHNVVKDKERQKDWCTVL